MVSRKIKKILLIQPPYDILSIEPKGAQPPLGLAYLAAVLEKNYEVKILDAVVEGYEKEEVIDRDFKRYGLHFDEIKREIEEFVPDVVGVSCLFSTQAENSHKVVKLAKEVNPNIITLFGGAHPSALPELVMEDDNVDFAMIGEGEYTTRGLLKALETGREFSALDGLAFRKNGSVRVLPKTNYIQDLNRLPFPARHLLSMEKYFKINSPMGTTARRIPNTCLSTSRGCPANCIFCSIHTIWGRKYRTRTPENVINEIEYVVRKYGVKELQFYDDNLTFDKVRAFRIFDEMIKRKLNLLWTTPNGVAIWTLDEELLRKMRESGCYKISLGIESGDDYVLHRIIQKPLNLKKVKPVINFCRKLGMAVDAFFVVGFPGETKEQMEKTLSFALNLKVDNLSITLATPHPGTRLYEICQRENYLRPNFNFKAIRSRRGQIDTPQFTAKEVEKMVSKVNFISRLELFFRSPSAFYERVVKRFFKQPKFFIALACETVKKMFPPGGR
ncbi:MAG: B12-binding domain-containing radical SAM protein [bacterium]